MEKYNLDNLINDSDEEINIELTDYHNGTEHTHTFPVPFNYNYHNEKRLICFSVINNDQCHYGLNCTYAHSKNEQKVDDDKKYIYQIILDKKLMNFFSMTNPKTEEIYKNLLFLTQICEKCINNKCTGGYNCRNGVCDTAIKICKNDLLTGDMFEQKYKHYMDDNLCGKICA